MPKIVILPDKTKAWFLDVTAPLVAFFVKLELNPNFFTSIGFVASVIGGFLFGAGHLRSAGLVMLLSGIFDIIDGRVARATNRVTKFGALYDSTLDRYSEVILFFGMAYYFGTNALSSPDTSFWDQFAAVIVSFALGGSIMVSYVRARAESLGFECKVGLMQRPERVVCIAFGAVIAEFMLIFALTLVAVLANHTALHRLYHVWQQENEDKLKEIITEE